MSNSSQTRRQTLTIALILLVALTIRLVWAFWCRVIPDVSDQGTYNGYAINWLEGKGLITTAQGLYSAYRPPVYPMFIALIYSVFGNNNYFAVYVVQSLLSTITVLLIYLLASRLFTLRIAIIAAIVGVLYVDFVLYNITLMTETLTIFLVTLAFWALIRTADRGTCGGLIVAGICLGIASLAKPAAVFLVPGILVGIFLRKHVHWSYKLKQVLILSCFFLLTISPWVARNWVVFGKFIPLADNGAINFYIANNVNATGRYVVPRDLPNSEQMEDWWYYREGAMFIVNHPLTWGKLVLTKLSWFFSADRDYMFDILFLPTEETNRVFHENYFRWKQGVPTVERILKPRWLAIFGHLPSIFVLIFCLFGLFTLDCKRPHDLLLYAMGSYVLIHVLFFFVELRFRMLLMPLFIVYAVAGLSYMKMTSIKTTFMELKGSISSKRLWGLGVFVMILMLNFLYTLSGFLKNLLGVG